MSHNLSSSLPFPLDLLPKASDIFSSTMCLSPIYLTNPDPGIPPFSNHFFNQKPFNKKQDSKNNHLVDLGNPIVKKLKPNFGDIPIKIPVLKMEDSKFQFNSNYSNNNSDFSPLQNLSERHRLGEIIPPFEQDKSRLLSQLSTLMKKSKKPVFKIEHTHSDPLVGRVTEVVEANGDSSAKNGSLFKKMDKMKKDNNSFYTINDNNELEEICIDSLVAPKPQQQKQPLRLPSFAFSELSLFSIPEFRWNGEKEGNDRGHTDRLHGDLLRDQFVHEKREILKKKENKRGEMNQVKQEEVKNNTLIESRDRALTSDLSLIIRSEIQEFRGIDAGNTNSVCSTTCENEVIKASSLLSGELSSTIAFQQVEKIEEKIEEKAEKEIIGKSVVLTRKMRLTKSFIKEEIKEEKVSTKVEEQDDEEEEEEKEVEVKTKIKKTVTISKILRNRIIRKRETDSQSNSKNKTSNAKQKIKGNLSKRKGKKFVSRWDILTTRRKNRWQLMKTKGTKFKYPSEEPKLITKPNRTSRTTSSHLKTPVGIKHQAKVPEFKQEEPDKRPIRKPKLTWNPEYLSAKKLGSYFKKIEEILECGVNQQKAIKILKENNFEPHQACKMVEAKKREFRKEFDLNSRKRKPISLFQFPSE